MANPYFAKKQSNSDTNTDNYEIKATKYADMAIIGAIKAINDSVSSDKPMHDGLMAYILNVDNLESISRAKGWIDDKDPELSISEKLKERMVKEGLDTSKAPTGSDRIIFDAKAARIKFEIVLGILFEQNSIYTEYEL